MKGKRKYTLHIGKRAHRELHRAAAMKQWAGHERTKWRALRIPEPVYKRLDGWRMGWTWGDTLTRLMDEADVPR